MQINLLPFLCEAFATNKKIYKDIDRLYQKDKFKFYTSAKEHELYNHQMAQEGSLLQDEYYKKALGIILHAEEYSEEFEELLRKGWIYTYLYVKNNSIIDMDKYLYALQKKNKGLDNITDDELNAHALMLVFLATLEGKNINTESKLYQSLISQLQMRLEHYSGNAYRYNFDSLSKETKEHVHQLKLKIFSSYGPIKSFGDILSIKDAEIRDYVNTIALLFDTENISSISIFSDIKLSDKDINEILHMYLLCNDTNINISEAMMFIVDCVYIKYLIKAYKQVKKHYFENNKETMFVELDEVKRELATTQTELKVKDNTMKKLQEQIERLERENRRLRNQLDEEAQNRNELNSLREFMFNLDKQEEYTLKERNFSKLQNVKGLVVGGHENWQRRMKELLPNFKFLHPDTLNIDISILDNVDIVLFYTNYLNHAMYYKVINEARKKNIKIAYISANTNENIVLQQIFKAVD